MAAETVERFDVGEALNLNWGGGLARSSVTLLGGGPGAGKSTLTMQLLSILAERTGGVPLFIGAEEPGAQTRDRATRLGIPNQDRIDILPLENHHDAPSLGAMIRGLRPCAVVLDSAQGFEDDYHAAVGIVKCLKEEGGKLNIPSILIGQINKAGDFQGLKELQHMVDTLLFLERADDLPKNRRAVEVFRRLVTSEKNRFGPAGVETIWEMTGTGLVHVKRGDFWRENEDGEIELAREDEEDDGDDEDADRAVR